MNTRTVVLSLILAILFIGCAGSESSVQEEQSSPTPSTNSSALLEYQNEISSAYLKKHLAAFSADSMKGREAGTASEKKAADYLAAEYREIGLKPVGDNNTYFQSFKLAGAKSDSVVFSVYNTESDQKKLIDHSTASKNSSANFIRRYGGTDSLQAEIVFAGFGVADSSRGVQHLNDVELKGKWVMVFEKIPHTVDEDTLINPAINTRARFQTIMSRGAKGMLIIPAATTAEFEERAQKAQTNYGKVGRLGLAYRDKESAGGFSKGYNIINPSLAARILGLESETALAVHKQGLIEDVSAFKPKELPYQLSHIPYSTQKEVDSRNVLAFYEGADPELKDEVVVLTSHYDHVGVGAPDSTGDRIYNGADDDGSGTIGLLNVARAFAKAGENNVKPKRSILFLNVSAEEKGLLGSRYYSDHPVFSMEQTVANINIDMIGRIDRKHEEEGIENYSYIIGGDIISSQLDSLVKAGNERSGQIKLSDRYNDLQDPNQFYRRSDHWHFGRKGVPFVFFFTGVHEDYHRPSDEVHKIRFDKLTKIVRTIYGSTVAITNAERAPEVDNQKFIEITKDQNF
ncbi:M28 family peptidase [Fodinibius halophilus]|uniref:M20/M25/M40 family metallo-hydrolase n=1 Tax=Fodinibius halophilus TaxID=1736908 RepID=A0A6M1T540_9BACT|nr:M28 family peptidase [Fodinibius halophilus]NGP87061.1 M20/M25/M40 family metallo-hydrolase [Fodinibius halophilus]